MHVSIEVKHSREAINEMLSSSVGIDASKYYIESVTTVILTYEMAL